MSYIIDLHDVVKIGDIVEIIDAGGFNEDGDLAIVKYVLTHTHKKEQTIIASIVTLNKIKRGTQPYHLSRLAPYAPMIIS